MLKQMQKKLKDIIDENEPILSHIQVIDYIKHQQQLKKTKEELAGLVPSKTYNLVATIKRAENDSKPTIYLFKIIEKTNDLKLKLTWQLNELKSVNCLDETQKTSVNIFELIFKNDSNSNNENSNRYVWKCESELDRTTFLNTLWKLSEEFLKASDRPKFINCHFENKTNDMTNKSNDSEAAKKDSKLINVSSSNQYEITKSEEDSLLKLMAECDFASSNAESFIQKLEAELLYLDTSNIESIMNSEENTLKLIEMLDTAVEEIDKIDNRLQTYEEKISAVGDAVRIVGERDNVIQLQQNNQHALLDLLENMMSMLEFSPEQQSIINECDLSNAKRIERCVTAANQLLDVIETNLPLGLKQMRAYEEQINLLERIKLKFCNNAYNHLRNVIAHSANKHMETYKIVDNSLHTLPAHKQIHDDLIIFKELMPWIYKSNCYYNELDQKKTYYNDIRDNYIETVRQLYLREILPFCSCAKAKLTKLDKPRATASMENLKGSLIKSKADKNDQFVIKIDHATKEMLKTVLSKLLNHMTLAVQYEQFFCQEFFNLKSSSNNNTNDSQSLSVQKFSRTSSSASMLSNSTSSSKQQQSDSKNDAAILSQIFSNSIEEQVKSIIDSILKLENMMVMFVYSDLLFRVLDCHNNKNFMHQPLTLVLRSTKEKCDEFINHFKDLIREYKIVKREKIGILKYVMYFEEFVKESESCWELIKTNMYEKLINIYQGIINEIWKGIETVANESQKTPPEVVRFQNYHQMHHIMRGISNLKDSVKFAKEKYTQSKDQYVKELFGQPLEKLHNFFEKVDAQIQRGCKHEDVQYKLDLSADKLREIIREYPAKEVKKGLELLYLKVEKHLVENSSLLEVVWQNMSSEFINQYKYYESLIKTCYPGKNQITLEFTEQDICEFFRDIAQKH